MDNTLSRALAERDPGQVVMAKALLGATATTVLGVGPGRATAIAGGRVGAVRHWRQRPRPEPAFLVAVALGDRSASGMMALGSALMLTGVVLHLAESHGHEHAHEERGLGASQSYLFVIDGGARQPENRQY